LGKGVCATATYSGDQMFKTYKMKEGKEVFGKGRVSWTGGESKRKGISTSADSSLMRGGRGQSNKRVRRSRK